MNWKVICRNIGYALLVSALFMFISILVSISRGNDSALAALIISFIITFIVGVFPFIFVRRSTTITLKEGYVIITLSWLLSFIFGMLPYALWGGPFSLQNALFESVSGYTTTGATILDKVEALPKSLMFWRASTHFIGGLGVIVFLLLIIPESSPMRLRLANMELTSLSRSGYASRTNKVVYIFAYVYIALVLAACFCYLLAGMSFFDAICHAMSVVATGGFGTHNTSIAAFHSHWVEGITMVFMYLSSIHFGIIYLTVVTKSVEPLKNPILKFYTFSILIASAMVAVGFRMNNICPTWSSSLWNALFETLCISSSTGFALLDNSQWPMWIMTILVLVGISCGCAGSTCGGIKADRTILLFKALGRYVNSILHPYSINEVRMGRKILRDDEVSSHFLYICLYMLVLLVSTLLCQIAGMDEVNSFVAPVMCLGNVGSGYGVMGTMGSYNSVSLFGKLLLSLDMFLGRIEIYPVLAVLGMLFDRRNR